MVSKEIFDIAWHAVSVEEAGRTLETNLKEGLSEKEAASRRAVFGENALPEEKLPSRFRILLRQFFSPLIFILLIAGILTLLFRQYTDSIVILGTLFVNALIGYFQEYKATTAFANLKKILQEKAIVIRERNQQEVLQEQLAPGDIVQLTPGSKVPADGRIIEGWNLQINEAVLTGEWVSAFKHDELLDEKTPLADRDNMVYMGTTVEEGNGKAVVTATGMETELGNIGSALQTIEKEQTPYQKKLRSFSWTVGILVVLLALGIFAGGLFTGRGVFEMFTIGVAIAVAAVPEGLPITITIVLAIGMQRILRQKGLVRHLTAAETLGSTSVIATDKTLTLTEGKMEVEEIVPLRLQDREQALVAGVLANEAFVENPNAVFEDWILRGRPTDKALVHAAMDAGISKVELERTLPVVLKIPFSSETKYIASFHQEQDKVKLYVSGAPERIMECSMLSEDELTQAKAKLGELTERGLRVICVGSKDIPDGVLLPHHDLALSLRLKDEVKDLYFIGFIALKDPLRKDAKEAIQAATQAGMKIIVVTGDHVFTARAVAKELGLPCGPENVIEGQELEKMPGEELASRIKDVSVFARVEPKHKLRIIEAWQNERAVIAMTGDGVNDAPALKKADIGIALGSGTDVAKEASDLVLLSDEFSIIPAAIKEGRVIVDNIRKIITYMLSGSFTETILIGASFLVGAPFLPVTALQILWINLLEDTFPSIALAMEKPEKDVMKRKPPKPNSALLTGEMKVIIFAIGILTDFLLLGIFFWLLGADGYAPSHIQTVIFAGLGVSSLLYVFSCKSLRKNIWEYNPFSNLYLVGSVLLGFLLLFAVVYAPALQSVFHTARLNAFDWTLLLSFGIINGALIEISKWYFIRRDARREAVS